MANQEHLEILKQGVDAWNQWRRAQERKPDLSKANLTGAKLFGANLWKADVSNANFSGANLSYADLQGASFTATDLSHADLGFARLIGGDFAKADLHNAKLFNTNLKGANLSQADLTEADLTEADLTDANLSLAILCNTFFHNANLSGANLDGADFRDAAALSTIFGNCDLRKAKGLDFVRHLGPSSIGIDTIYTSAGRIPESFLRGCGVPEGFITEMHSLVGAVDGIQFYSCFISYSSKDEDFAKRLHGKMRDAHLRVWFAPEDIRGGKKLHEQIETAIRIYDKLLVVLSEASLQSEWVMTELRKARKAERQSGKRKLFPVRLVDFETLRDWECFDADSGKDLAVELREYFIPDFSNWKDHDQFEPAFSRLLKDLRADEGAT